MMDGQHKVAGKAGSITIGGRTFGLNLWTLGDRAELVAHLVTSRISPLATLGQQLDAVDVKHHEGLMRAALREAVRQRDVTDEELRQYLGTFEGSVYVFWIMVRRQHPEISTLAAACALVEQQYGDRLIEFQGDLDQASGLFSDLAEVGNSCGPAEMATAAPAEIVEAGRTCTETCLACTAGPPKKSIA